MSDEELLASVDEFRNTMVAVATGGPRIDDVNQRFQATHSAVTDELTRRGIQTTLPYGDLWDWYGRWTSGDMPSYRLRRTFLSDHFNRVVETITVSRSRPFEPTGWERVDRTVGELRKQLAAARVEEQFQAVGLLCREALISVAQAVYISEKHGSTDGVLPSPTDAKRQLEAYITSELGGGAAKEARAHARSALDLSLALQHKRTAAFRDAALCVEATTAVVNIIAITSGKRDFDEV